MLFLDTNSHLTTKPYNFDIKCQSISESCDRHGFFWTGADSLVPLISKITISNKTYTFFKCLKIYWNITLGLARVELFQQEGVTSEGLPNLFLPSMKYQVR